MTTKLELRHIVKRFESVTAVDRISLRLEKGEFLSLLGPSGCGKSTTLAMIAGFLPVDEGEIAVDGKVVNRIPPQRRRIGLVFQDYAIFSRLSVRQNLSFGLEARRVPKRERRDAVSEIAEKFALRDLLERRGGELNMSEMQRLALARVLVTKPELLLLDEPMSNLDASLRANLRGELKHVQKDLEQTVLYVTHDQVEAMSMSDRIAVMRDGKLVQVGTPQEIYHRPVNRFVAEFIGDPPINILPCSVQRDGAGTVVHTAVHQGVRLEADGISTGEHLLGVRPYAFHPFNEPGADRAPSVVRFLENFGAEHVLHVQYGDELARVVAPPGFANEGDTVHLALDRRQAHLIDRETEEIAGAHRMGAVA